MPRGPDYIYDDDVTGKVYDAQLMRRLLKYLAPYAGYVFLGVFFLFL